MKKNDEGQIIIIVSFVLIAALLFLAVIIDGARLMARQQEMNRVADAAGKAGLIIVGDHMVTQVVEAQKAASEYAPTAAFEGDSVEPNMTPTPWSDDFFYWVNDDHKKTLVAPPMQTLVAAQVLDVVDENGLGLSNSSVTRLEIIYPASYRPGDKMIRIKVRIERVVPVIFGKLWGFEDGVLFGEAEEEIPQR